MALPVITSSLTSVTTRAAAPTTSLIPSVSVKQERPDDKDIIDLANQIRLENKLKMADAAAANATAPNQAQRASGQQGILSYMSKTGTQSGGTNGPRTVLSSSGKPSNEEKPPIDITSQRESLRRPIMLFAGKFGWTMLGGEHIPYIVRTTNQGDKYCSVRMVEQKVLSKYLKYLSSDIFSCTCICSYYILESEAKLLNEINTKHCDSMFGKDLFTTKDLVVLLDDANEFYQFLDFSYKKLLSPTSEVSHERCGFVRINKDSVVPYTVKDKCRYVPLFYFEGETDTLKKSTGVLGPWDLAYLKFCCKVQGIRSELFANDDCPVISLSDIKSFFPAGTVFDEYWPTKTVDSQLLVSAKSAVRTPNTSSWIQAPPAPNPTSVAANAVQPSAHPGDIHPGAVPPTLNQAPNQLTGWQAMLNRYPNTAASVSNSRAQSQASAARLQQHVQQGLHQGAPGVGNHVQRAFNRNATSNLAYYQQMNSAQQQQQLQQNLQSNVHNQTHPRVNNSGQHPGANNTRYYGTTQEVIDLSSPPHSPNNRAMMMNGVQQLQMASSAARGAQPAQQQNVVKWKNLIQIMETPPRGDTVHVPFKIQKALVASKMVPCINAKPYLYSELLMTVNDLMDEFFPNVSMTKCREVLQNVLNINLYSGNLQQKTVLREEGKCRSLNEILPLVQLKDVLKYMPQLKYVLRNSAEDQQPAQKRVRMS